MNLEFFGKKALPSYKYYLVPRKTDSMKNLLKYQMASKKVKPIQNTSNPEEPKRHEITIHSAVVSNTGYREQISKAKEAD